MADSSHQFGGPWTEQKLGILRKYLSAYTTALSKQPFKTAYVDAFAGTGYRQGRGDTRQLGLEEILPIREFLDGSARVALQCEPAFDRYVFIEKHRARCQELEKLKSDFPDKAIKISIALADANDHIQMMCNKRWEKRRAVLFLDPYGMEVRWQTIEAIAKTKAIDLWVLFPLSGVNRMLTRSGKIPLEWKHRLNELFGTTGWYEHFYKRRTSHSLFNEKIDEVVKVSTQVISDYFLTRLRECFAGVNPTPAVLYSSRNSPLYLFCFAAGNPRGAPIALKIASDILRWDRKDHGERFKHRVD